MRLPSLCIELNWVKKRRRRHKNSNKVKQTLKLKPKRHCNCLETSTTANDTIACVNLALVLTGHNLILTHSIGKARASLNLNTTPKGSSEKCLGLLSLSSQKADRIWLVRRCNSSSLANQIGWFVALVAIFLLHSETVCISSAQSQQQPLHHLNSSRNNNNSKQHTQHLRHLLTTVDR